MSFTQRDEHYQGPDACPCCNGWGYSYEVLNDAGDLRLDEAGRPAAVACDACAGSGDRHGH